MLDQYGNIDYKRIFVEYARKLPDDVKSDLPTRYQVLYPIWHPAVFPSGNHIGQIIGMSTEDCIKQFIDLDYACCNPANIDAAILYKKEPQKFIEKNKQIFKNLKKECPICFQPLEAMVSITCHKGHVYHDTCTDDSGVCPVYNCKIVICL